MDPLVSVVIPVFNRANLIARTVESIRNQTYSNWEIVIVDDFSSDDLLDTLKTLPSFDRITYVRHDVNKGVSAARNTGVQAAKGDFIAFIDSDDEWHPEKLERQVRCCESLADPEKLICGTLNKRIQDDGSYQVIPDRDIRPDETFEEYIFIGKQFVSTSSFFLSRKLALEVPFTEHLRQYEDHLLLIQLGNRGVRLVLLDEVLGTYHADDRPGRLGSHDSLDKSRAFYAEAEQLMTVRGKLAFQAHYFAPFLWHESKMQTFTILKNALFGGAIGLNQALIVMLKCTLGEDRHAQLRDQYKALRGVRRAS